MYHIILYYIIFILLYHIISYHMNHIISYESYHIVLYLFVDITLYVTCYYRIFLYFVLWTYIKLICCIYNNNNYYYIYIHSIALDLWGLINFIDTSFQVHAKPQLPRSMTYLPNATQTGEFCWQPEVPDGCGMSSGERQVPQSHEFSEPKHPTWKLWKLPSMVGPVKGRLSSTWSLNKGLLSRPLIAGRTGEGGNKGMTKIPWQSVETAPFILLKGCFHGPWQTCHWFIDALFDVGQKH